ncbi:MAG: hypothetical protein U0572_03890 [Phycisphaerales bacterium]
MRSMSSVLKSGHGLWAAMTSLAALAGILGCGDGDSTGGGSPSAPSAPPAPSALVARGDGDHQDGGDKDKDKHKDKDKDGDKSKDKKHDGSEQSGSSNASAPADPNAVAFYLSMHGSTGSDSIVGVTSEGKVLGSVLTGIPADNALHLLRGMCLLPDRTVLVSNAYRDDTKVLRFGPIAADGTAPFMSVFLQGGSGNAGLSHTYDVVLAPDGSIYCSNQDTNTVTRYAGPTAPNAGSPLPAPPSLANVSGLAPGVFIPNEKDDKDGIKEVRGLAIGPDGFLYVADKGRSRVTSYDTKTGKRHEVVAESKHGIKNPIQLVFSPDGRSLFIGDNGTNSIWKVDLASRTVSEFVPSGTPGVKLPSALTIDGDRLLIGSRETHGFIAVRLSDGQVAATPFISKLPDAPEFLLRVK